MAETGPDDRRESSNERELMASSDAFMAQLGRLEELEQRKRVMLPLDEERLPVAREIEDLTVSLVGLSRYQTRLVAIELSPGPAGDDPRKPAVVLAEWRTAEREARDARSAMEKAVDTADRLRDEHGRAVRHHGATDPRESR
jgi:hypothetical protein